jgi:hypothetical protein
MRVLLTIAALSALAGCRAHAPKGGGPSPERSAVFYRELIENECSATKNKSEMECCIASVEKMRRDGLEPLPPEADRCPNGGRVWSKACKGSLRWCGQPR